MSTPIKSLPTFMETEPVTSLAVGFSLIFNGVLLGLPLFGVALAWEQAIYLAGMFNTVLGLVTYFQRSRVSPVEKANDRIEQAAETGVAKTL
jgi:hypothetical protein